MNLFNTCPTYEVFESLLKFCIETKQKIKVDEEVISNFPKQEKEIYLLLTQMYQGQESFEYLLKYINLTKEKVEDGFLLIVLSKKLLFLDLPITEKSELYPIYLLLKNKKYNSFEEKHKQVLTKFQIPVDLFELKLKLLNLSLHSKISFDEIRKEFKVENVEEFLIKGKSFGLKLKIDQIEGQVNLLNLKDLTESISLLEGKISKLLK